MVTTPSQRKELNIPILNIPIFQNNRIFCLTKDAAPKKGGAGRFSFLILPDFLGSIEKHFPPATRLPGFGPCDLGSILPSRLPLEITTCEYVQATLLHLRGLAGLERRERVETHDNS